MTPVHKDYDKEVDVLVVGSGAGGMASALAANANGLDTLIVEKATVKLTPSDATDEDNIKLVPERLRNLIARSKSLQIAVRRLDATIHAAPAERAPIGNPLVPQLNRLKAAFEQ